MKIWGELLSSSELKTCSKSLHSNHLRGGGSNQYPSHYEASARPVVYPCSTQLTQMTLSASWFQQACRQTAARRRCAGAPGPQTLTNHHPRSASYTLPVTQGKVG